MNTWVFRMGVVVLAVLATLPGRAAWALSSAFTYQGHLVQNGAAVNGVCDLQFSLWDAAGSGSPPTGGAQLGSTVPDLNENVENGLFTVELNYGDGIFLGADRWLQIAVRCPAGSGAYTTLGPRQRLTATPYALFAGVAGSAIVAADLGCNGCVSSSELGPLAITSQQIADGSIEKSDLSFVPGTVTQVSPGAGLIGPPITTFGELAVDFGTTAGTVAEGNHSHDTSYWSLGGNTGTVPGLNVLGTIDASPLHLVVNGQRALRLEPGLSPNVIGGWNGNGITDGAIGGSIGGGGGPDEGGLILPNTVAAHYGVIAGGIGNMVGVSNGTAEEAVGAAVGGGFLNEATARSATVSGGIKNTASGDWSTVGGGQSNRAAAECATIAGGCAKDILDPTTASSVTDDFGSIGGGQHNRAGDDTGSSTSATHATVGGGGDNVAGALGATVGGGGGNQATGQFATVPGGALNFATGAGSFAAGRGAVALEDGSFVWSDGTLLAVSQGANTFNALASGGFRFYFNATQHCDLTGTGGWQCLFASDRALKTNLAAVEGREVLAQLATIPIQRWSYASEERSVSHVGPMAQDFHAAFGLGENEREINTVDASGVALAAIQGLYEVVREKDEEIAALRRETDALAERIAALEAAIRR